MRSPRVASRDEQRDGAAPRPRRGQRGARVASRARTDCANAAASTPATLPNTSSSVSEFEPSRFAPWMPTLEHSPAEYRPGSGDAVRPSATMPPIV